MAEPFDDDDGYSGMSNRAEGHPGPTGHKVSKSLGSMDEAPFSVGRGGDNWMTDSRASGPGFASDAAYGVPHKSGDAGEHMSMHTTDMHSKMGKGMSKKGM